MRLTFTRSKGGWILLDSKFILEDGEQFNFRVLLAGTPDFFICTNFLSFKPIVHLFCAGIRVCTWQLIFQYIDLYQVMLNGIHFAYVCVPARRKAISGSA